MSGSSSKLENTYSPKSVPYSCLVQVEVMRCCNQTFMFCPD
ncbi:formyltetrahydrofolate deformylase 2, mitochondrial-like [Iris pallida]|uniref:Formyltetrahydrofolate deformylase 2, mitochondrial-like n=1 Tax=Iris pallida TaxID=29817 RepID=A0AAX6FVE5_IRIPA|nr:formyltetrahydrofolate deformylase 2, mitochondrial-like [Iris pallida]